jgi:hypothetical protein
MCSYRGDGAGAVVAVLAAVFHHFFVLDLSVFALLFRLLWPSSLF